MMAYIRHLYRKVVANPELSLLGLFAFSLPFDHFPSIQFSGLTVKLSALCALGMLSLLAIRKKMPSVLSQKSVIYLVCWLLWVGLGMLRASDFHAAIKTAVPIGILGLSAIAVAELYKKQMQKEVVRWILIGGLIACLFGIYQFIGNRLGLSNSLTGIRIEYSWERFGFPRMESTALEPLYFSAFLLLPASLLLALLFKDKQHRNKLTYGLLGLFLLCDFLTLSRGGLVAMVLLIGLTLFHYRNDILTVMSPKRIGLILAGLLLVIGFGFGAIALVSRKGNDADLTHNKTGIQTLISHLTDIRFFANNQDISKKTSIGERDIARQQSVRILKQSKKTLLIGTGAGQDPSTDNIKSFGLPNNLILELILQYGLVGFGLFLAFMGYLIKDLWRVRQQSDVGMVAFALLAYFIALLFQAQSFSGLALPHFWFAIGLAVAIGKQKSVYKKRT
jgi:O-antigen ligase